MKYLYAGLAFALPTAAAFIWPDLPGWVGLVVAVDWIVVAFTVSIWFVNDISREVDDEQK